MCKNICTFAADFEIINIFPLRLRGSSRLGKLTRNASEAIFRVKSEGIT